MRDWKISIWSLQVCNLPAVTPLPNWGICFAVLVVSSLQPCWNSKGTFDMMPNVKMESHSPHVTKCTSTIEMGKLLTTDMEKLDCLIV